MWLMEVGSLIDWILDARFRGYTDLQSLVKCLDHRGIMEVGWVGVLLSVDGSHQG